MSCVKPYKIKRRSLLHTFIVVFIFSLPFTHLLGQEKLNPEILPIELPEPATYTELDVRYTTPPPRFEVTPPTGAPNVVVVLIDDLGFGATSTYGGPIYTPTMDRYPNQGRPDLLGDRKELTLYPGMDGMIENTFLNIKNKSFTISADIETKGESNNGALLLQGGGIGKGGDTELYVNDKLVTKGRFERTLPNIFSVDETADVGLDNKAPVGEGIGYGLEETTFTGKIDKIILSLK